LKLIVHVHVIIIPDEPTIEVLEEMLQKCSAQTIVDVAYNIGSLISKEVKMRADQKRKSLRKQDMKNLTYEDAWKAEVNPAMKKFFEGIVYEKKSK
jgi:hypothetical protein